MISLCQSWLVLINKLLVIGKVISFLGFQVEDLLLPERKAIHPKALAHHFALLSFRTFCLVKSWHESWAIKLIKRLQILQHKIERIPTVAAFRSEL